jgi:hypothetical protein
VQGGARGGVDDRHRASRAARGTQHLAQVEEDPVVVDPHQALERVGVEVGERHQRPLDPRVVVQRVHAAEMLGRGGEVGLDVCLGGDIAGQRQHVGAQLLGHGRRALAVDVHERDPRALLHQSGGGGAPDARRAARDDHDTLLEALQRHRLSP